MAIFNARWFRNASSKDDKEKCKESEQCNQLLQLILDGEASSDEENYFFSHKEKCIYCSNGFELEKSLKDLIKTKIKKETVPADLVESIKLKIQQTV